MKKYCANCKHWKYPKFAKLYPSCKIDRRVLGSTEAMLATGKFWLSHSDGEVYRDGVDDSTFYPTSKQLNPDHNCRFYKEPPIKKSLFKKIKDYMEEQLSMI